MFNSIYHNTFREQFTLSLLAKFRSKLDLLKQKQSESEESKKSLDDNIVEKEIQTDDWLAQMIGTMLLIRGIR